MVKQFMAIISISIFLSLAGLALRAWRKRTVAQSAEFSAPPEALDYFGQLLAQAWAFYVATTREANHLERISAYGLGARGKSQILVFTEGVLFVRKGERPLAIGRSNLISFEFTQVAIDKAVEPKGLLSVGWLHDEVRLATQVRIVDQGEREIIANALTEIISTTTKREIIK
jgi:hypothetical protein